MRIYKVYHIYLRWCTESLHQARFCLPKLPIWNRILTHLKWCRLQNNFAKKCPRHHHHQSSQFHFHPFFKTIFLLNVCKCIEIIALPTISPSTRLGKLRHSIAEKHMKRRKPVRNDWHGFILSFFLGSLQFKHDILKKFIIIEY